MDRVPNQPFPGSDFTPSLSFVPSLQASRLFTSPNAVQFAWYQALPDTSYNPDTGTQDALHGKGQYIRTYQAGTFWLILSDSSTEIKKYAPGGVWETGTVALAFDPAVTPLSIYDWVIPLGQSGIPAITYPPTAINARTYTQKETVVRGATKVSGAGKATIAGTAVTGTGTAFTTFFKVGDVLWCAAFSARITAIASDTSLTLEASATYTGIGYSKGTDVLSYCPVAFVQFIVAGSQTYIYGTDFLITSGFPSVLGGDTVQWLDPAHSPAPGQRYAAVYNYIARYELSDYGQKAPVVGGASLLSSQLATLWKPQVSPNI
jgi:hypothetical protein